MTRTEAAVTIAAALDAADYSAGVWAPEGDNGPVRVYVTIPAASYKKKARKIGYVSVELDGTICGDGLDVQRGTILALIPDLSITPVTPAARTAAPVSRPAVDDDVAAFEASERSVVAAETNREQG